MLYRPKNLLLGCVFGFIACALFMTEYQIFAFPLLFYSGLRFGRIAGWDFAVQATLYYIGDWTIEEFKKHKELSIKMKEKANG